MVLQLRPAELPDWEGLAGFEYFPFGGQFHEGIRFGEVGQVARAATRPGTAHPVAISPGKVCTGIKYVSGGAKEIVSVSAAHSEGSAVCWAPARSQGNT